jgi:RimJ/RimL family protein N-acetyltransferase
VGTELLTERLRLREWRADDISSLTEVFAKPEVWHFPLRRAFTGDESRAFLARMMDLQGEGTPCPFAAEMKGSGQLIGYVGLSIPHFLPEVMPSVEIGWRVDPSLWRNGLATEGARAVLTHAFDTLGLGELVGIYEPENEASGNVMQRIGMHFDRDTAHPDGGLPLRVFRLSKQEWVSQVRQTRDR